MEYQSGSPLPGPAPAGAHRASAKGISRRQVIVPPEAVFTHPERILLERATPQKRKNAPRDLAFYMTALARLGGYLDRDSDPPPGTTVIWRGFTRLADLDEGFRAAQTGRKLLVGN